MQPTGSLIDINATNSQLYREEQDHTVIETIESALETIAEYGAIVRNSGLEGMLIGGAVGVLALGALATEQLIYGRSIGPETTQHITERAQSSNPLIMASYLAGEILIASVISLGGLGALGGVGYIGRVAYSRFFGARQTQNQ